MSIYDSLFQLRSDLEQLKKDRTLSIEMIEQRFIHAMKDKMISNYQEVLSKYVEINEDVIANFDQNTILAFLTLVIRMERFMEDTVDHNLRSGLVLIAIERLATLTV